MIPELVLGAEIRKPKDWDTFVYVYMFFVLGYRLFKEGQGFIADEYFKKGFIKFETELTGTERWAMFPFIRDIATFSGYTPINN